MGVLFKVQENENCSVSHEPIHGQAVSCMVWWGRGAPQGTLSRNKHSESTSGKNTSPPATPANSEIPRSPVSYDIIPHYSTLFHIIPHFSHFSHCSHFSHLLITFLFPLTNVTFSFPKKNYEIPKMSFSKTHSREFTNWHLTLTWH